jgi:uncharacterized protein
MADAKNVLGGNLEFCCGSPVTGCETGPMDMGVHVVCAEVSEEFLVFSQSRGNDLMTPMPQYDFPGLQPGDRWCLCASRWKEALDAGVAPPIVLSATHEKALEYVSLDELKKNALNVN